jgi:SAM-dependent methyltransferase
LPTIANAAKRDITAIEADYKRLYKAQSVDELLNSARIEYHAPADATATRLPPNSVDVVFSNSVMEHVPRAVILALMRESRRILRSGGLSIHSVNCGDHYAYFDRKITPINYLTYTERKWRFWNNRLLYQNRLRPQDFLDMAGEAGLETVLKKHKPRQELLAALPRLKTAPEFQHYSPEQLCTTSIDFVARKR